MLVRLKVVLLKRGLKQGELARAIGRTPAHVSRLIHGHARLRSRDRRRIASFLGVSAVLLFPSRQRSNRSTVRPESDRACVEGRPDA
jgi:transcriptional regulator with XRE-family HTH domain